MSNISAALKNLKIGPRENFSNFSLFPLLCNKSVSADYLTLDKALALGQARIVEVSAEGDISSLKIINQSNVPVMIVDGEELLGARQNRVANITVLVPPLETILLPVSPIDSAPWNKKSYELGTANRTQVSSGRRNRNADVSAAMRRNGALTSNDDRKIKQWRIWGDTIWGNINKKSKRMSVTTPTGTMTDIFASHAFRLEHYVNAFNCTPMQVGIIFAINEHIEGIELFDSPTTLTALHAKLIRSYAVDATARVHTENPIVRRRDARRFLRRVMRAHEECYSAIGLGEEIRVSGNKVVGGGLMLENRLLHLAVFANPQYADAMVTQTQINAPAPIH